MEPVKKTQAGLTGQDTRQVEIYGKQKIVDGRPAKVIGGSGAKRETPEIIEQRRKQS